MRKILITEFGGPEVLRVEEHPDPTPPTDGYVVQMAAIGMNYADVVLRRGRYRKDQPLPTEIGFEGSGTVIARGPEATEFAIGDEVVVVNLSGGTYAEQVALGPQQVLPARKDIPLEVQAGYANTFATAWYSLVELGRVRAGESVLIQAAAGGVGSAAVQMARALGCSPVLATAGGPEKCAFVEGLGADACLDYRATDFREGVAEHTGGQGVHFALDSVGGEVFERCLDALAPMGHLVFIGFSSIADDYANAIQRVHPLTLFHRSLSLSGLNVSNLKYPTRRAIWDAMNAFCVEHALAPQIGGRFALDEAPAAHTALQSRGTVGKLLLIP